MASTTLVVRQGDDFLAEIPVPNLADTDTVNAEIRWYPGGPLFSRFTVSKHISLGVVRLRLNEVQTAALRRSGRYDVERITSGGVTTTLLSGAVRVLPQVTTTTSPVAIATNTWGAVLSGGTWGDLAGTQWGDI